MNLCATSSTTGAMALRHRAEYYAIHGFIGQPGRVIKIDRQRLAAHCVREYVVNDLVPEPSICISGLSVTAARITETLV